MGLSTYRQADQVPSNAGMLLAVGNHPKRLGQERDSYFARAAGRNQIASGGRALALLEKCGCKGSAEETLSSASSRMVADPRIY